MKTIVAFVVAGACFFIGVGSGLAIAAHHIDYLDTRVQDLDIEIDMKCRPVSYQKHIK